MKFSRFKTLNYASYTELDRMVKILRFRLLEALLNISNFVLKIVFSVK